MTTFKPTDEQVEICDAAGTGVPLVIDAAAGSGKTSTLKLLARQTDRQGMYLAYNRAIKDDAVKSFPGTVRCLTSHGLAYKPVATRYKHRLGGPRVPAQQAAGILGINEPVRLAQDLAPLAPAQLARIALNTVQRFCYSADDEPAARHVPLLAGLEDRTVRAELARAILPIAGKVWADIQSTTGQLRFEHDHYLKMYQLTRPQLNVDYLLVDEAQDLNPVVQAIVSYQTDAQVILVGDRNQQLYAWRGAVDAMSTFDGKRLCLTQSFRFGPAVAEEANKWLTILGADIRVRGFDPVPSVVGPIQTPDAILCRTNGAALGRVIDALDRGRRPALVGDAKNKIAKLARAAVDLQSGRPTDHPELLAFSSWHELRDYVEQDKSGSDLKVFVDLIEKIGAPEIIAVVDRLVDEKHADVVMSTGHSAKGREWNRVAIANDFREPKPDEDGQPGEIEREDAMLAYVSVTRAKLELDRTGLAWVDRYLPLGYEYGTDPAERPPAAMGVVPVEESPFAGEDDGEEWPAPVPASDEPDALDEEPAGPAPMDPVDHLAVELFGRLIERGPEGNGWLSLHCLRCRTLHTDCDCALPPDRRWTKTMEPAEFAAFVQARLDAPLVGAGARIGAVVAGAQAALDGA